MTHTRFKNKSISVLSLIMVFILLLPTVLSSCMADDDDEAKNNVEPLFEAFNWDMTDDQYKDLAAEKVKYILADLFPRIYSEDIRANATKNNGASFYYNPELYGHSTDAQLSIKLTTDLRVKSISVTGPYFEYERLTQEQVAQIEEKLQKKADPYGDTLTTDRVSFSSDREGGIIAGTYVRYEVDGDMKSEWIKETIDPLWIEPETAIKSEAEIRESTDQLLQKLYGITDFSNYKVTYENNVLIYKLLLSGYETNETFVFEFSPEMNVTNFTYNIKDFDRPSDYFGIVSADDLDKAFDVLNNASDKKLSKEDCYLGTNDQYLTMCVRDNMTLKCSVGTVYELVKDELAAIKAKDPKYKPDYEGLTDEQIKARKTADEAVMEKYGLKSLSNYKITVNSSDNGYTVIYVLTICGVLTDEKYDVKIGADGKASKVDGNFGEVAWVFSYIDLEKIQSQLDELDQKYVDDTGKDPKTSYRDIEIDKNKNLSFFREAIVNTEDSDGHEDHYHFIQSVNLFVYNSLKKTVK